MGALKKERRLVPRAGESRIDPVYRSTVNRRPPKEAVMPLSKGKGKKAVSKNVKELMHAYDETGKIGTSRPKSKAKAVKQAVAISLKKAGKSKGKKK